MHRRDSRGTFICRVVLTLLASLCAFARPAQAIDVLYGFDSDVDQTIRDWLTADGSQDPTAYGQISVDPLMSNARFGEKSLNFPVNPFALNVIEIPDSTSLGSAFTLAAFVNESADDFSRLFSSYDGGSVLANELVFDIDPSNTPSLGFGVRAIVNGTTVKRAVNFSDNDYHHVAMTYDNGSVRLYLDGTQLGPTATVPGGAINLAANLRFGEDYAPTSLTNEPLEGLADDVLVYSQALSPQQIQDLVQNGAATTFNVQAPPPPKALGSKIEMFVDGHLLGTTNNVALQLHAPEKQEIVLTANQQYETPTSAYYTLLRDGDEIRMYYRGNVDSTEVTLMATSTDGINFTRPNLGVFTHDGSSNNHIVWEGAQSHNLTPFIDTNPGALPSQRYKAIGGSGQIYGLTSPDGIHWSLVQPGPLNMSGAFDSQNTVTWDDEAGVYRAFVREWVGGVRAIQMTTSTDFINWTPPQLFQYDVPLEHFYTNGIVRAPGAEQIWLGFPMRFDPTRTNVPAGGQTGVTDAIFMSSRDGFHWDRTFTEPWIPEGFDSTRSNMPAWGILETSPTEWSMYASEHYQLPDNRMRRLTLRPYGFASLHADSDGGSFETPPLTFVGDTLVLNFETGAGGSILVQIEDEEGNPISGFTFADAVPLSGDSLGLRVEWTSGRSLLELEGQVVRLSMQMSDADLFALQFAPASLLADLNRDGVVDIFDVNLVSANWGTSNTLGDANRDGTVDIFDVNAISGNWGQGVSLAPVPEPPAFILTAAACGCALISMRLRRRRHHPRERMRL